MDVKKLVKMLFKTVKNKVKAEHDLRFDSDLERLFYDTLPKYLKQSIRTQYQIGAYRVDFAFVHKRMVIELDGHEYHAKLEQRERDAKRDRHLAKRGWLVLRFTSSEVFRDAQACIKEVEEFYTRRK